MFGLLVIAAELNGALDVDGVQVKITNTGTGLLVDDRACRDGSCTNKRMLALCIVFRLVASAVLVIRSLART